MADKEFSQGSLLCTIFRQQFATNRRHSVRKVCCSKLVGQTTNPMQAAQPFLMARFQKNRKSGLCDRGSGFTTPR
jgi:hypothetical protein